jgi:hypothetical protein
MPYLLSPSQFLGYCFQLLGSRYQFLDFLGPRFQFLDFLGPRFQFLGPRC